MSRSSLGIVVVSRLMPWSRFDGGAAASPEVTPMPAFTVSSIRSVSKTSHRRPNRVMAILPMGRPLSLIGA